MTATSRRYDPAPRCLTKHQAASYCNLPEDRFEAAVARGILPASFTIADSQKLWDVKSLDDALDRVAGRVPNAGSDKDWLGALDDDHAT